MSASDIQVVTFRIWPEDGSFANGLNSHRVDSKYAYQSNSSTSVTTISSRNARTNGDILGVLYVPNLDEQGYNKCPQALNTSYIPAGATNFTEVPPSAPVMALFPWIDEECAYQFLSAISKNTAAAGSAAGAITYQLGHGNSTPPAGGSSAWDISISSNVQNRSWVNDFGFPVYAVPTDTGQEWMAELPKYNGTAASVPNGQLMIDHKDISATDYVRLVADVTVGNGAGIPSLWVFLLMVVGILIVVIGATSGFMHCLARSRRNRLRRRVANGEIDLEALGIKRLRVPPEVLDKMPRYEYVGVPASAPATPSVEIPAPILGGSKTEMGDSAQTQATSFRQQTCAICLDDFVTAAAARAQGRTSTATSSKDSDPISSLPVSKSESGSKPTAVARSVSTADSLAKEATVTETEPTAADNETAQPSIVRELPCGHIFHAECVDPFLTTHSSLCPLCKKSSLPAGFVPRNITNTMVRRERQVRNLRGRGIRVDTGSSADIVRRSVFGASDAAAARQARGTPLERAWERRLRLSRLRHLHGGRASEQQQLDGDEMQQMPAVARTGAGVPATMVAARPGTASPAEPVVPADAIEAVDESQGLRVGAVPVLVPSATPGVESSGDMKPWWRRAVGNLFPTA